QPEDEDERDDALAEEPERHVVQACSQRPREGDHEEQVGEGHRQVDEPRDRRVGPAAVEACGRARDGAEQERQQRCAHTHLERDLRAVEEPQELVPRERRVGAEDEELLLELAVLGQLADVRPRPGRQLVGVEPAGYEERLVRPVAQEVRGERSACERGDEEQDDEHAARERQLVTPEAEPDALPVAARLDCPDVEVVVDGGVLRRQCGSAPEDHRLPVGRGLGAVCEIAHRGTTAAALGTQLSTTHRDAGPEPSFLSSRKNTWERTPAPLRGSSATSSSALLVYDASTL